ncbi:MAG: hypothetical protein WCA56_03155 [Xanthobacteraceae bacterium]
MPKNETIELAGPTVLIAAIGFAELGAHALANWPTSSFLWYLNLEVFQSFRYSPDAMGLGRWLGDDGFGGAIWVAIPLMGLVCIGRVLKIRLPLALASNISLIYSGFLLFGSYSAMDPTAQSGDLKLVALWGPSTMLAFGLLLASLISSMVSHRVYWREIFS